MTTPAKPLTPEELADAKAYISHDNTELPPWMRAAAFERVVMRRLLATLDAQAAQIAETQSRLDHVFRELTEAAISEKAAKESATALLTRVEELEKALANAIPPGAKLVCAKCGEDDMSWLHCAMLKKGGCHMEKSNA